MIKKWSRTGLENVFGVIHTWAIRNDEFFTYRRLLVTPCGEGYAEVPAEMGQAFLCSLEGYSAPGVHASQQVPLPFWCQFESSRGVPLWEIKYRRGILVVYVFPSFQPRRSPLDSLTLQRISLLFYKVTDTMQLSPSGFWSFLSFLVLQTLDCCLLNLWSSPTHSCYRIF